MEISFETVELKNNDVLIVKLPERLAPSKNLKFAENIMNRLKKQFPDNKIIVTMDGVEILTSEEVE